MSHGLFIIAWLKSSASYHLETSTPVKAKVPALNKPVAMTEEEENCAPDKDPPQKESEPAKPIRGRKTKRGRNAKK